MMNKVLGGLNCCLEASVHLCLQRRSRGTRAFTDSWQWVQTCLGPSAAVSSHLHHVAFPWEKGMAWLRNQLSNLCIFQACLLVPQFGLKFASIPTAGTCCWEKRVNKTSCLGILHTLQWLRASWRNLLSPAKEPSLGGVLWPEHLPAGTKVTNNLFYLSLSPFQSVS